MSFDLVNKGTTELVARPVVGVQQDSLDQSATVAGEKHSDLWATLVTPNSLMAKMFQRAGVLSSGANVTCCGRGAGANRPLLVSAH